MGCLFSKSKDTILHTTQTYKETDIYDYLFDSNEQYSNPMYYNTSPSKTRFKNNK